MTLRVKVILRQCAWPTNGIYSVYDPVLDTTEAENDIELNKAAADRKLHKMAKVHDFLEMWQGSQNVRATQKESRAQNKQMTAVGYFSDPEEIVNASWTTFKPHCAAAFKLSERSPQPPALSSIDLPGGRTQLLNICRMKKIDRDQTASDENRAPESISDSGDLLHRNDDLENPNLSEDSWEAHDESKLDQDNVILNPDTPKQQEVCAQQNVPGLIRPPRRSKPKAEMSIQTVSAMETRRNKWNKKK